MVNLSRLRARLVDVDDVITLSWDEVERLTGKLPPSATKYRAYWSGLQPNLGGFRITNVRKGKSVTFVREEGSSANEIPATPAVAQPRAAGASEVADLILVSCAQTKLDRPAQAQDLYASASFRKLRSYAQAAGGTWFILSAKYGLLAPTDVIGPYDLALPDTSKSFQQAWGLLVLQQLINAGVELDGLTVEIHAGSHYVNAIRSGLEHAGATVILPLEGLRQGERQNWYDTNGSRHQATESDSFSSGDGAAIERLSIPTYTLPISELTQQKNTELDQPGLYSWWVDALGAAELSNGLGHTVDPGLIYAGLAGGTLRGRILGMHLNGSRKFSTLRESLASILGNAREGVDPSEEELTDWIRQHLRVAITPVTDTERLKELETSVLAKLDPPLNLQGRPTTQLRAHLSRLRSASHTPKPAKSPAPHQVKAPNNQSASLPVEGRVRGCP